MAKLRDLRARLRAAGFSSRRGKGSHEIWKRPGQRGRGIVLSGKDGEDAERYQEKRVRKVCQRAKEQINV